MRRTLAAAAAMRHDPSIRNFLARASGRVAPRWERPVSPRRARAKGRADDLNVGEWLLVIAGTAWLGYHIGFGLALGLWTPESILQALLGPFAGSQHAAPALWSP